MRYTFVLSIASLLVGHLDPVRATPGRRQALSLANTTSTTDTASTAVTTSPPLITGSYQSCAIDPVYAGLWSNSDIQYYATSFCLDLLASPTVTNCLSTDTTRKTVAPVTTITDTTTATSTVPSSTVTVTATDMDFKLASGDSETGQPATITPRSYPRIHLEKRQSSNETSRYDLTSALASACTCRRLTTPTKNVICTSTSTIYQTTILYTSTTVFVTTTSGIKTETTTVSTTTSIPTTGPVSSTTQWVVTVTTEDSWGGWNGTTTTGTTMSTTSTTTSTYETPTGCPYSNGTTFSENPDDCTYYERVCGRSYADSDFYPDLIYSGETPEDCTNACDAFNNGKRDTCLGLVWSTLDSSSSKCRFLKSLDTPVVANDSIALLIRDDPKCKNQTTSMTSTTSSSSMALYPNTTMTEPPYTTMTYNKTVEMNTTTTTTTTTTSLFTYPMNNTSSYPTTMPGTGTGTIPTMSNSTYCPASTLTETTTIYATLYNTVPAENGTDSTKTITVTVTTTDEPKVITTTGGYTKTKHHGWW